MPAPRFSIIIPCWNPGRLLGEAIRSLQRQGPTDWEAILIDDGSSDGSARLAADWATADPRLRAVPLARNCGAAAARNIGLGLARGEYVGFLDADDIFADGAFAAFEARIGAGRPDLVKGGIAVTHDAADPIPETVGEPWDAPVAEAARGRILQLSDFTTHLYRRAFLEECRIRFEEELHVGEDRMFLARAQLFCANFAMTDRVVYVYRKQNSATMETPWSEAKRLSVQAMLLRMRALIDARPRAERLRAAFFLRSFPWQCRLLSRSARVCAPEGVQAHMEALRAAAVAGIGMEDEFSRAVSADWPQGPRLIRAALVERDWDEALRLACAAAARAASTERSREIAA